MCLRLSAELIIDSAMMFIQERIASLKLAQVAKKEMADLIELNSALVDRALLIIRSLIANQVA